jgi:hypothetical protein
MMVKSVNCIKGYDPPSIQALMSLVLINEYDQTTVAGESCFQEISLNLLFFPSIVILKLGIYTWVTDYLLKLSKGLKIIMGSKITP